MAKGGGIFLGKGRSSLSLMCTHLSKRGSSRKLLQRGGPPPPKCNVTRSGCNLGSTKEKCCKPLFMSCVLYEYSRSRGKLVPNTSVVWQSWEEAHRCLREEYHRSGWQCTGRAMWGYPGLSCFHGHQPLLMQACAHRHFPCALQTSPLGNWEAPCHCIQNTCHHAQ